MKTLTRILIILLIFVIIITFKSINLNDKENIDNEELLLIINSIDDK